MLNITKKLIVNTLFQQSFRMEERSNSITQTNDENRDQGNNQNVCCNICTRTFRTKRGLLQYLNYC